MAQQILKVIALSGFIFGWAALPAAAQPRAQHYIIFLEDASVAEHLAPGEQPKSETARTYQQQIQAKQEALKSERVKDSPGFPFSATRTFSITVSLVKRLGIWKVLESPMA